MKRKRRKLKQQVIDIIGVIIFYLVIILGVLGVNWRFNQIYNNNTTTINK